MATGNVCSYARVLNGPQQVEKIKTFNELAATMAQRNNKDLVCYLLSSNGALIFSGDDARDGHYFDTRPSVQEVLRFSEGHVGISPGYKKITLCPNDII